MCVSSFIFNSILVAGKCRLSVLQSPPGGPAAIAGGDTLTARPLPLASVLLALLLKPMLAWLTLKDEVQAVETAPEASPDAGRERLSWQASRDTAAVSQVQVQVRESAIASLAETSNTAAMLNLPVLDGLNARVFIAGLVPGICPTLVNRAAQPSARAWRSRDYRQGRAATQSLR